MKYLLIVAVALMSFAIQGFSQSQNLFSDTQVHTGSIGTTDLDGFTTYRIFAQLATATEECVAVVGYDEMPISISTTTSFYQSPVGSSGGDGINLQIIDFIPDARYDSYTTIGYATAETLGIPYSEDASGEVPLVGTGNFGLVEDPAFPWEAEFENGANISILSYVGGAWFGLPGSANVLGVGVNNSVLLGQFTTDGDFDYCLNYQVLDDFGNSTIYSGACTNAVGCGDELGCNYNPEAITIDNSLCSYPGSLCYGADAGTLISIYDENCDCVEGSEVDNCEFITNTISYCYENNEETDWLFSEMTEGQGVTVNIVTGEVESNFDEINVYEGQDGVFELIAGPIDGEISGMTFSTDSPQLRIELITDGSVSCASGSQETLFMTYSCATLELPPVNGCMDEVACNYNANATDDDGSCAIQGDFCLHPLTLEGFYNDDCECVSYMFGCMDEMACNFNPDANIQGPCLFAGDACLEEGILNGIYSDSCGCEGDILGCTDVDSGNFNPEASVDDGSCSGAETCEVAQELTINGGTVVGSNVGATDDNDSEESGCNQSMDGGDVWYTFTGDGSIVDIETHDFDTVIALYTSCDGTAVACNDDGGVGVASLIEGICTVVGQQYFVEVEGWNGGQGPFLVEVYTSELSASTAGCSDPLSCNYDVSWTCSDEFCVYPGALCDDNDWNTINDMYGDDCECIGEYAGCTDVNACNYDANASSDDGTCILPGASCDDLDAETINDIVSDTCECLGEYGGCTDSAANNYDELAATDDGSCCFGEFISIVLYDGFGDGGSAYSLSDNSNIEIASGALTTGSLSNLPDVCVADGCYLFQLTSDFWEEEVSADIFVNGALVFQHEEGDSFEQYPIVINVGNDPECVILGCIDNTACNFSGLATEDNGTCDYESCVGCSVPGASNYSEIVTQDDGSCSWDISGVVFIDDNFNGVLDPFEQTLPYQNVIIATLGEQIITDNNGAFMSAGLEAGVYEIYVEYTGSWTNYTTPIEYTLDFPLNGGYPIYFGVTNENVPAPSACVDFYQWGAGVPCNDQLGYNICYRNMSPYPISGVIEIVLDDLLEFNSSTPVAETIDGQTITWSFENLASWEMFFDDIIVNTPSEENIGDFMSSHVTIYVDYEGELIPVTEQTIVQEVTCAYDPNDITGIPAGYTEDHLVLADTRMEYLIRFQNTGNASATDVLVVDTLDQDMDFSTFQLVANSHNVMTTIDESGRVEFLFEDINLPDSIADEAGSHGMISFKIDFMDDIVTGEEVNSTAHIFFDNNPAVITNTTWHTIHECGGEAAFDLSSTAICKGEQVSMTSTNPLVESYQWNIQSSSASTLSEYNVEFPMEGDYIIQLVAENPLCTESTMQMLTVHDLPEAVLTQDGAFLTANEGLEYQWLLNDEPIYGEVSQTYEVIEDGIYTVEVINENGCSDISEAVMVVSIEELEGAEFEIYPNPMSDVAFIEFTSNSRKTIKLLDSSGKKVRVWENITDQRVELARGSLAKGTYFISVQEGNVINNKAIIIR